MTAPPPVLPADLDGCVRAAKGGDEAATHALLEQFRPLLRSRMHSLWGAVRGRFSTLEWDDIEAQITFLFLSRLYTFRADDGVYFPYYAEKMLDLDIRGWLRTQSRGAAIPFSQLANIEGEDESIEPIEWLFEGVGAGESAEVERRVSLHAALEALPPEGREVVWRCCVLGRTEAAVADELGISRSAVHARLERAIAGLRACFEDTNGTTRTGRAREGRAGRERALAPRAEFWEFLHNMVKNEQRPDLVGVGAGRPVLLQGTFDFAATGLKCPELLSKKLSYIVPIGHVLGVRYLRVGNVSDAMIVVSTVVNGLPHRIVPCAANDVIHVPFAIVDPITPGSQLEIHIAANQSGTAIIDCGCLQMPA